MTATFTVETGAGLTNANAYVSQATVTQYNDDHEAVAAWVGTGQDAAEQKAIRQATAYLDRMFRFRGSRYTEDQALAWPRTDFLDSDGWVVYSGSLTQLPKALENACCELAIAAISGDTFNAAYTPEIASDSISNEAKSESVSFRTTPGAKTTKVYPRVRFMLRQLIHSGALVEPC